MKYKYPNLRMAALSALAVPMLAFAGNIPQYTVSKKGTPYSEFSDGTPLSAMVFSNGNGVLFADNRMFYDSEITKGGFPIGFDFRMGGQTFDCFAISNHGELYLGKGDVAYGKDTFRLGMSTITCGLYKADVSYKTEGVEGERVLTVQYKNAVLNETTKNKGKYNLQLRLYEADGKIEMAFNETETCYGLGGFVTGLRGWDDSDALLLTARGLDMPVSISPWSQGWILESDSYINWDSKDYDNDYSPVFVFTPDNNTEAPKDKPQDLTVEQQEDRLLIRCTKADSSDATVVLVSDAPFTEADMPVDGETFRAGQNEKGEWYTKLGNSIAVYYGNEKDIEVSYKGIEAGKDYYVCAIAANGYPAYNRDGRSEQILTSSQAAPEELRISSDSADGFIVSCKADYPVIVASTTVSRPEFGAGYVGVFGVPTADAKVGDELPGGGTIVYVGETGRFRVDALPNRLTYFRAWTVDGDHVSATATDGTGIPMPSFPYEPGVENYPLDTPLWGWIHSDNAEFVPVDRAYAHDRALSATSIDDAEVSLTTPSFVSFRNMTLTFEFAMETEKDPAAGGDSGSQLLPQGYEPGHFDETGYFHIMSGENLLKDVTEYNGTMKAVPTTGGNEDGSSSFESVEVAVPHTGEAQTLTFAFSTPKKSRLYIRNISIKQTGEAPALPENAPANLTISYADGGEAMVNVKADRAEDAHGTLLLLSVGDFEGNPEDGKTYKIGDQVGNATVLYHGTDDHIEAVSIPVEGEREYVVTGFSHNPEGSFGKTFATSRLITTGIGIVSNGMVEGVVIYNVSGIRVSVNDINALPAGLYIINGKKVIIRNK